MKYPIPQELIPFNSRHEINNKILLLIESGNLETITPSDIFAAYTGDGGLHGLERENFNSFFEYTKEKKEIEQGQFFTPASVCQQIVSEMNIGDTDLVADLTSGMGNFFNALPMENNIYGCELDTKAVKVARFLYPQAHISQGDVRYYNPDVTFDVIVGNPPFNLRWNFQNDTQASHWVYLQRSAELLNPGGLLAVIVPASFLSDDFMDNNKIQWLNENFYFIAQSKLKNNAFQSYGVKSFPTKVIFLQKRIDEIEGLPYAINSFNELGGTELKTAIHTANSLRFQHRIKIQRAIALKCEANNYSRKNVFQREGSGFSFLLRKLLFEIKTHPQTKIHSSRAYQIIDKFHNQNAPEGMDAKEWEMVRLTEAKVLSSLRRILKNGLNPKAQKKGIRLDNVAGGFMFKSYGVAAKNELAELNVPAFISYNDIFSKRFVMHNPIVGAYFKKYKKLISRRERNYLAQAADISTLERNSVIDNYLNEFKFIGGDQDLHKLNPIQLHDVGNILQKPYGGILNWEQGGGKSVGALSVISFLRGEYKNTFIVAPPIAISMTWEPMLKLQGINFKTLTAINEVAEIQTGDLILVPISRVDTLSRALKRHLRIINYRALLIFDESDEISNYSSKRSRAMRVTFGRVKRKLLTTGTITRNNLAEMYGQLELLFNNSANFENTCWFRYKETRTDKGVSIRKINNENYGKTFFGRYGYSDFKSCFSPSKSTVFGIGKHNQDIYNPESLELLIRSTIITRKFRDIVGPDRYDIHTHTVVMDSWENEFYEKVLMEFNTMLPQYFSSTGNSRKDSMLVIIRQLKLLIQSCSIPHLLTSASLTPTKAISIQRKIQERNDKRIMVGCTSKKAANYYAESLKEIFPHRSIFLVTGENSSFKKRQQIIDAFEATQNGILVCTQQSLSSSVNIPFVQEVFMESLQWSIPRCAQFYFRAIRFNSQHKVNVHFFLYENSIEVNMMTLLMDKERMNDYIKTLEFRSLDQVMGDFQLSYSFLDMLIEKVRDDEGNSVVKWGNQRLVAA